MFDFRNLAPKFKNNIQTFYSTTAVDNNGFQTWYKPKGASMVFMALLGGAGGGGAGFTDIAGNARGGGGGGTGSGFTTLMVPAMFLPDVLYVQVGFGGTGGIPTANSGNALQGQNSFVLLNKNNTLGASIIAAAWKNATGGGGGGSGTAAGAAGNPTATSTAAPFSTLGFFRSVAGTTGLIGGSQNGAAGTDATAWALVTTGAGAGGGGTKTANFSGGNANPTALVDMGNQTYFSASAQIATAGSATSVNGSGGKRSITPFFNSGGAGGAGMNSAAGGQGGKGGYGSGGGGGGGGTTGGNGGDGGDGIVMIISW